MLDTSVFVAAERGSLDLSKQLEEYPSQTPVAIAAITASELLHGIHRAKTPDQRAKRQAFVEAILSRVPCLPFDLEVARVHAQLAAELASHGTPVGAHDLIIAATAIGSSFSVATHDKRSFDQIPGLQTLIW